MIRLIDIENNTPIPTEHCYTIKWLKVILDTYPPKQALDTIAYIFYMTCNSEENPFFNMIEEEREDAILDSLESDIEIEDDIVINAVTKAKKMYETPIYRGYLGVKTLVDKLAKYMIETELEHGRDGNLSQIVTAGKNMSDLRKTFNDLKKDLMEEQQQAVRGGVSLGYDQ